MDFPAPVIAKITGYCLGGGLETAMSCDFRFAAEDAKLGLPEVDLGIIPGAGGVQFISELANPAAAKEIMTGDHISAARAEELGIVNRVPDDIDAETQEFAEKIASKPPLAIQAIKESASVATHGASRRPAVRPSPVRAAARNGRPQGRRQSVRRGRLRTRIHRQITSGLEWFTGPASDFCSFEHRARGFEGG